MYPEGYSPALYPKDTPGRGYPHDLFEVFVEVILVAKTAEFGYFRDFVFPAQKHSVGVSDPGSDQILVQGKAGFPFEQGVKIVRAKAGHGRHLFYGDFIGIMGGNIADDIFYTVVIFGGFTAIDVEFI
jgi:hypothetical protein